MLHFFEEKDGSLIFRENGETVMVTPWGADSFRVRAAFLGDIEEGSIDRKSTRLNSSHV